MREKRCLALLLALALMLALMPTTALGAATYNPAKALEYARGHWDIEPEKECAEFVSDCLKAGGLSSSSVSCRSLFNQLNNEVIRGSKIATLQYLSIPGKYIMAADNKGKVAPGDVLFWLCDYCGIDGTPGYEHTALVSNVSGPYVRVYQHNGPMNDAAPLVNNCYECKRRYGNIVAIHFGASAADVSFTGMKYPTTLTEGQSFALQGTIKSNSNITKVIAAIKQGGKQVKACTIEKVNAATLQITGNKEITKALDFASLPAGSYSVKYAVYNAAGGFEEWEKNFKVTEDRTAIEFTGMKSPTTLTKGQTFALQGTIKSNSNITKVIAAIKQGGKQVKACTIEKVNASTFKITGNSTIKKDLDFASLPAGSYSVKYAVYNSAGGFEEWEKNFKVTAPQHTHTLSRTAAKAATEAAAGNTEYWSCSGCGKYFSDSKGSAEIRKSDTVIPKLAHRHALTHVDRKNATESAVGNTEYWSCRGCGKYFSDANATQEIRQVDTVLPMLRHTHDLEHVPAVAGTCTSGGSKEYWRCKGCGLCFADQGAERALGQADIAVPPLGHSYENGVCTRDGAVDPDYRAPVEDGPDDIPGPEDPNDPGPEDPNDPGQEPNDPGQDPNDPGPEEPPYEDLPADELPNEEPGEDGPTYAVHFQRQTIFAQGQFTDVPADQWYTRNVAEAYELGLLKGTSADTFSPYGHVTLAEAITMACRIHSIYQSGYEDFVQDGNAWYQVYLDYAYENNIISWAYYNADVSQTATRAQFAEIFANALPEEALGAINSVPDGSIPDVPMSSAYARYAYQLYRAGILTGGDANGTFSPNTYITRAEAAAIVSRMAESDNRVAFTLD